MGIYYEYKWIIYWVPRIPVSLEESGIVNSSDVTKQAGLQPPLIESGVSQCTRTSPDERAAYHVPAIIPALDKNAGVNTNS